GPEMKSTGEVMGIDKDFPTAFAKAQQGASVHLPTEGGAFISVRERDKPTIANVAKKLTEMGFNIIATSGTSKFLEEQGLTVRTVNKVPEGRPHCVDAIQNGDVQLVINTTEGAQAISDSFSIRRSALVLNIPHYTTVAGADAAVGAIDTLKKGTLAVSPLQDYFTASD
ncbi:MAG: carbamoyl phosphate synthase large subunit, partial [Alphaproteobacteria bacterium]|nr:carbamoyl phosphate synthase large subunit [Alphaproteobacteria bacterium]